MMDEFDFKEEKPKRPPRKLGSAVLNTGSLLALIASLCSGGYFLEIFLNPQGGWNPFPPATVAPTLVATQTSILPTAIPTATYTPAPTGQPTATVPALIYGVQDGNPVFLNASLFRPDLGCSFHGVFGQVFGLTDAPITGARVQVTGNLGGAAVNKLGLTGAATQYGSGAYYEVQLGNTPVASNNALQIAVVNENGQTLSSPLTFSTHADCNQNLILINFRQLP